MCSWNIPFYASFYLNVTQALSLGAKIWDLWMYMLAMGIEFTTDLNSRVNVFWMNDMGKWSLISYKVLELLLHINNMQVQEKQMYDFGRIEQVCLYLFHIFWYAG